MNIFHIISAKIKGCCANERPWALSLYRGAMPKCHFLLEQVHWLVKYISFPFCLCPLKNKTKTLLPSSETGNNNTFCRDPQSEVWMNSAGRYRCLSYAGYLWQNIPPCSSELAFLLGQDRPLQSKSLSHDFGQSYLSPRLMFLPCKRRNYMK